MRLGFSPFVSNLDNALEGGIPEGSWVSLYGPPGGYKTLHSLAFCLNGIANREKCVYVSTEMDFAQLKRQLESLGWEHDAYETHYTSRIIDSKDFGLFDLIWIDLDSLRYWAWKLNQVAREEKEGGRKKVYFWYNDPTLLTHVIMIALGAVGVLERNVASISLNEVLYARIKDGLFARDSKYKPKFTVNKNVHARVIIDSISPFIIGKYSIAGKILTDMKVRLAAPNITYVIVSHVAKTTEEELGANIGHVVDGRIRLWLELDRQKGEAEHYGWIVKMRETNHSRKLHRIILDSSKAMKQLVWTPTR